jgi:DNA-binding NtrC family response regulator
MPLPAKCPGENHAPLSILIVDDDLELRTAVAEALGTRYAVTAAASGKEALAAQPELFDLILLDFWMPGMSGQEVKRELDRRGVSVPVVLASSDPSVGRYAMSDGFFDFLHKPFDLDQLHSLIARIARDKTGVISIFDLKPVEGDQTERLVIDLGDSESD